MIWPGVVAFLLVAWLAFGDVLFLNASAEDGSFSEGGGAEHFASTEAAGDGDGNGIFFGVAAALLDPLLLDMFPGGGYKLVTWFLDVGRRFAMHV